MLRRRVMVVLGLLVGLVFVGVGSSMPVGASAGTTISASTSATSVVYGQPFRLQGTVTPATATPVVIVQQFDGGRWVDRGKVRVDASTGSYVGEVWASLRGTVTYRVQSQHRSVSSPTFTVTTTPRTTRLSLVATPGSVHVGDAVLISGNVVEPDAVRSVVVERKVGTRWSARATATVDQRTGEFSVTIHPGEAATYLLRVRTPGGTRWSPTIKVIVRP